MRKKIIFRCDGASISEIGTGHVVRDLTISKLLIKKKVCSKSEIGFVIRKNGLFKLGYDLVRQSGFTIISSRDENLSWNSLKETKFLSKLDTDNLIFDRLSTNWKTIKNLKGKFKHLISMDDIGSGAKLADVVINGLFHNSLKREGLYQGYKYLLLNNKNNKKKIIKKKIKYIFVSFGGHDELNLTGFFLDTIIEKNIFENNKFKIEILVSNDKDKHFRLWKKKISFLVNFKNLDINLYVRSPDFYKKLNKADIAIVAGGLTVFEAINAGVASIGLPQYSHQLKTLKKLQKYGAVKISGETMLLNKKNFLLEINKLINSYNERLKIIQKGQNLIDGKGSRRVIKIISSLIQ